MLKNRARACSHPLHVMCTCIGPAFHPLLPSSFVEVMRMSMCMFQLESVSQCFVHLLWCILSLLLLSLSPPNDGRQMNVMNITFFRQFECKQTENEISNVVTAAAAAVAANANVTAVVVVVTVRPGYMSAAHRTCSVAFIGLCIQWYHLHFICARRLSLSYIYLFQTNIRQISPKKSDFEIDTPKEKKDAHTPFMQTLTTIATAAAAGSIPFGTAA